jgi:hypothetical protein
MMTTMKRCILPLLLVLLIVTTAHACPNCKDSVPASNADNPAGVGAGINASVYLMLGAFLTVLGFILNLVVKASRTTQRGYSRKHTPSRPS